MDSDKSGIESKEFGRRKNARDVDEAFPTPAPTPITPVKDSKGYLIKSEQTVNVFLIAMLSAATATIIPFRVRWVAEQNGLRFYQQGVTYAARTDGHLRDSNGKSRCIIEVKPRERFNDLKIRVQESAQMAAWISDYDIKSHNPNRNFR